MEKDRQAKIIAIVALFIGVATLTLGFAAFSAKLRIQSKATVTPDADSFKVVLSKEQTEEVVGKVTPTGEGDDATISNAGSPTISNLKASFVNPGEKVVYEFYALNTGYMDAYLNKIEYVNVTDNTANKVCTAGEGTTASLVSTACESIRVTVKVGEDDKACQTSMYGAHKLEKGHGEKVVVTIEYDKNGVVADGPFNVEFGDITLNYSATDSETKNVSSCTDYETQFAIDHFKTIGKTNITDADGNGRISISDKVTLGTESFYVISVDETAETVTMLSEWNLNVGNNTVSGTKGIQNSACKGVVYGASTNHCTLAFSSTNYWSSSISSYPAWVYSENSDIIYTHVENYVTKLKESGYSSVTGRLIKYEELISLGCAEDYSTHCKNVSAWIKNTTFWSGSAYNTKILWVVYTDGTFGNGSYFYDNYLGVRPVITISASEI